MKKMHLNPFAVLWSLIAVAALGTSGQAATFVVDTTSDANLRACSAAPNDCSLRGAIANANVNVGADTIAFNVPGAGYKIIAPTSALPTLSDANTLIDGYSQPGYVNAPLIVLNGAQVPSSFPTNGLNITTSNCRVRGLNLQGWHTAIQIAGSAAHSNRIEGCFIGTDVTGLSAPSKSNTLGIEILSGAHHNSIGGLQRNIISGNSQIGILISGAGSDSNSIAGNFIGLNARGDEKIGNGADGILILAGAQRCIIGSNDLSLRNVISGNGVTIFQGAGIRISGVETAYHSIINNYIGTDATGNKAGFGNNGSGVFLVNARNNRIGLPTAPRNVISGNGASNIEVRYSSRNTIQNNYIGPKADGSGPVNLPSAQQTGNHGILVSGDFGNPNPVSAEGNLIGGTQNGTRNIISGNPDSGISLYSLSVVGTLIQGNHIGTNAAGDTAIPNGRHGIQDGGSGTSIGGGTPQARNVISGNGVDINAGFSTGVFLIDSNPKLQGNFIGTNARGTAALPNIGFGVYVLDANTIVGGTTNRPGTGAGNVISGNGLGGVGIQPFYSSTEVVRVLGNLIGTDFTGTRALANGVGVAINGGSNTIIGSGDVSGRNIISGNRGAGIQTSLQSSTQPVGTRIQGNFIGTDISGQSAMPNTNGIELNYNINTLIGGATPRSGTGPGNVISGNRNAGILVGEAGSTIFVYGNAIGVAADGTTPLPNTSINGVGGWGIYLEGAALNIGAPGDFANLIAHNEADGVAVGPVGRSDGYSIRGNSIFNNGGLGIDLGDDGVTLNDEGDADTGANGLQNFPVLNSAAQSASGAPLVLNGTLDSTADQQFAIDVYANPLPDASGYGEGKIHLGSFNISTGNGVVTFNQSLDVDIDLSGKFISLTATDISMFDTSEFSAVVEVNASPINLGQEDNQPGQ